MRTVFKTAGLLLCLFSLTRCSSVVPHSSIPKVISGIQKDFAMANTLSISNFSHWSEAQQFEFDKTILQTQCQQNNADPIVPTISGDLELSLVGSFTSSGSFSVGSVLTTPTLAFSGQSSHSLGQTLNLPITFTPLSSLADVFMRLKLTREVNLYSNFPNVQDKAATQYAPFANRVLKEKLDTLTERDALQDHVSVLIQAYTPLECREQITPSIFSGVKKEF